MRKNYFLLVLTLSNIAHIFGSASSSSDERNDHKLRSLAREHASFVIDLIYDLKCTQVQDCVRPKSLVIYGSARNGKKSLAREIAYHANRSLSEHRIRKIDEFREFVEMQAGLSQSHITLLKGVHLFREPSSLEEAMNDLGENGQVFLVAVADSIFKSNEAFQLFDFELELQDPLTIARREILEFNLAGKEVDRALIDYFVIKTDRISSGKLSLVIRGLIADEVDSISQARFDELLKYVARAPKAPGFSLREWSHKNKNELVDILCFALTAVIVHYRSSEERKCSPEYKNEVVHTIMRIVGTSLKIMSNNK